MFGDLITTAGPTKNFNDNDADNFLSAGDTLIKLAGAVTDAGDDPDDDFITFDGTSMAAPHVAGTGALLYQRATNNGMAQARDHKVMKSILMNTTDKKVADKAGQNWFASPAYTSPTLVLDDQLGAGALNGQRSLYQLDAGEYNGVAGYSPAPDIGWDVGTVAQGGANSIWYDFGFLIPAYNDTWFGATLNWDIPVTGGSPAYAYGALSNLDLLLWLDPTSQGGRSTLLGSFSSTSLLMNTELILALLQDPGYYSLEVRNLGDGTVTPTNVPFGLAWYIASGQFAGIPEPSSLGLVAGIVTLLTRRMRARA